MLACPFRCLSVPNYIVTVVEAIGLGYVRLEVVCLSFQKVTQNITVAAYYRGGHFTTKLRSTSPFVTLHKFWGSRN
jgi:hypothetical protein